VKRSIPLCSKASMLFCKKTTLSKERALGHRCYLARIGRYPVRLRMQGAKQSVPVILATCRMPCHTSAVSWGASVFATVKRADASSGQATSAVLTACPAISR
jgi:hypothetical protein